MKWITRQIGARELYAVPRVLQRAGKLERLYTDFWASTPWRVLGKLTGKGSLATRYHPELARAPVTAFNFQALKASRQHLPIHTRGLWRSDDSSANRSSET